METLTFGVCSSLENCRSAEAGLGVRISPSPPYGSIGELAYPLALEARSMVVQIHLELPAGGRRFDSYYII